MPPEWKNWLSEGANILASAQVAAAFVTALATLALWYVTRILAKETKALARMTSRPFVVCSLESSLADALALDLVVRSTGNATAFDVRIGISPPLPNHDGTVPAADGGETTIALSLLPPQQALPIQGVLARYIKGTEYAVSVSWAELPGQVKRETLSYKLTVRDGFKGGWTTKGLHQVAQELEKIRNAIVNDK